MAIVNEGNILSILSTMNPWWQTGTVPKTQVKDFRRNGYYTCKKALESDLRRIRFTQYMVYSTMIKRENIV